jgi:HEAT repeat protein
MLLFFSVVSVPLWLILPCRAAEPSFDKVIDSPMYRLPPMPVAHVEYTFPAGAKELWLRVLRERTEVDMKCKAAHAIATAHRDGVKGFETTIPDLLAMFDQKDQHATVLLAVAEALIALDAKQASASFFRHAQSGDSDLRELVEPALARWDHRPAREAWLSRLREPTISSRNLTLAIRCLAVVREEKAVEPLRQIVLSERVAGPVRLQAARALAELRTSGLEKDAERLCADSTRRGSAARLAAAALLRQHRGAETVALLQRLAGDSEPAVAAPAVARLLEIAPELLDPWVDSLLAGRDTSVNRDANLRLFAVQLLHRRPSEKHLHQLIGRLDDEHSGVRRAARESLRERAGNNTWRPQILKEAIGLLKTDRWRQLEQATILLARLDHKPAAPLLVRLLESERPEVSITAAWGLRKLNVADTLPGVVKHVEAHAQPLITGRPPAEAVEWQKLEVSNHRLSQLNQLLGQQKYRAAEPLLRRFIRKPAAPGLSAESRAAALWALGLIHEGPAPDDLVKEVVGRVKDTTSIPPEDERVRWMSAIALGQWKTKDKEVVAALRNYFNATNRSLEACGWALEQITGEPVPPIPTAYRSRREWFLVPR